MTIGTCVNILSVVTWTIVKKIKKIEKC